MVAILAILVCAVFAIALGMFWYSPSGFGLAWMKEVGMTQKKIEAAKKKGMHKELFANVVATLIMVTVLSWFVRVAGATTIMSGAWVGFLIWLGFYATVQLGSVLWEQRSIRLYLINTVYNLVVLLVAGAVLAVWV